MNAVLAAPVVFNPRDSKTWPVLLTSEHMAEIFGLSAGHINRLVCAGQFQPMPKDMSKPRRWRRIDVLRATGEHEATR